MTGSILVFGMPRSGTTWVGKLFDSHTDTLYRHEPDSVQRLGLPLYPELETAPQYRDELERFVASLPRMRAPKVVGKQPLFPKSYQSPTALGAYRLSVAIAKVAGRVKRNFPCQYRPTATGCERARLVWKSIESPGRLGVCVEALPDTLAIHLMRHPCGYVASVLRGEATSRFGDTKPSAEDLWVHRMLLATSTGKAHGLCLDEIERLTPEERLAWRWVLTQEKILADVARCGRVLTLRYEDVCADPLATTRRMFEFTGLEWQPQTEAFIRASTQTDEKATDTDYLQRFQKPSGLRGEMALGSRSASHRTYSEHFAGQQFVSLLRRRHTGTGRAGGRAMNTAPLPVATDAGMSPLQREDNTASLDIGTAIKTDGQRKIRLLVFTSLYPNAAQPRHGIFVEERLRRLVESGRIEATVVAPVPWFPFRHRRFGAYATFARVPAHEQRFGIPICHPRYLVIPKLGMGVASSLMFRALLPVLRRMEAEGTNFDLIDAHYFYPDGVAAARLGAVMGKPVVVTARGSDVTWLPRYRRPRRQIQWAARSAAAIVTVSQALKVKLVAVGVASGKIAVLRNGVDLDRFAPRDRAAIRTQMGLTGPVWLTVGNLVELKGVHITLAALAKVPDVTLLIAGQGPEEARLRRLVDHLGIGSRVRFLGAIPHAELCEYYNATDAMVLASSREGMPNVVLESLACGTPVVAAPFDGVTELLDVPEAGEIAAERSAEAIAAAWLRLRDRAPGPATTRRYAERFGWSPVVQAQQALYDDVLRAWQRNAKSGLIS